MALPEYEGRLQSQRQRFYGANQLWNHLSITPAPKFDIYKASAEGGRLEATFMLDTTQRILSMDHLDRRGTHHMSDLIRAFLVQHNVFMNIEYLIIPHIEHADTQTIIKNIQKEASKDFVRHSPDSDFGKAILRIGPPPQRPTVGGSVQHYANDSGRDVRSIILGDIDGQPGLVFGFIDPPSEAAVQEHSYPLQTSTQEKTSNAEDGIEDGGCCGLKCVVM